MPHPRTFRSPSFRFAFPLVALVGAMPLGAQLLDDVPVAMPEEAVPAEWRTPAEVADYRATPSYDETLAFLRRVEAAPGAEGAVKVEFFGESAAGRKLPLVIVSKEKAFTPGAARALAKPLILVLNGIHAGEIDGKDASLLILRDLAIGRRKELLDAATLLIVPIYNVDGHERVSPWNRPNQDGPVDGMGFRATNDGHDLNRDFLKLETPEARQLVALFNAWQPHLVVDDHVTDGVELAWEITWAVPRAPQLAAPLDVWLTRVMPQILFEVEISGHPQGPYVDLVDDADPMRGFDSVVPEPRYSTGYFPLRNRPVILIETHAHKPYRDRVLANREMLEAIVRWTGETGLELRSAVAAANLATAAAGSRGAAAPPVVLTWERAEAGKARVPFHDWKKRVSPTTGADVLDWERGKVREEIVPWIEGVKPATTMPRPRGYLVPPGWPAIERRLADHALRFDRLPAAFEAEVGTTRVDGAKFATSSYQGLVRVTAGVTRAVERRTLPAGTLWIPADQPDFEVAVQLLEPEAPDSLFSWGLISGLLEGKEYIGNGKLDALAADLLRDPAVKSEWEAALRDPAFAADRQARYRWWYRRTPYWDEQQGLLPVFRALAPPPR